MNKIQKKVHTIVSKYVKPSISMLKELIDVFPLSQKKIINTYLDNNKNEPKTESNIYVGFRDVEIKSDESDDDDNDDNDDDDKSDAKEEMYKIGYSCDPSVRFKYYGLKKKYIIPVTKPKSVEKIIHNFLFYCNITSMPSYSGKGLQKEWFGETWQIMKLIIDSIVLANNCIDNEKEESKKSVSDIYKTLYSTFLININTASHENIVACLKDHGISNALATRIITYRKNNKFKKIEDIMFVPYIKTAIYSKVKKYICV